MFDKIPNVSLLYKDSVFLSILRFISKKKFFFNKRYPWISATPEILSFEQAPRRLIDILQCSCFSP